MAVTEYQGVVINKLTLAQYKTLKAANQLVASQSYIITDLDEQLERLENDLYWQFRVGRAINSSVDVMFFNETINASNLPANVALLTLEGQSGIITEFKKIGNQIIGYLSNGYSEITFNNGVRTNVYSVLSTVYGQGAIVSYIHPAFKNIIDDVMRINKVFL